MRGRDGGRERWREVRGKCAEMRRRGRKRRRNSMDGDEEEK